MSPVPVIARDSIEYALARGTEESRIALCARVLRRAATLRADVVGIAKRAASGEAVHAGELQLLAAVVLTGD